jgi:hypothetical protein
MLRNPNARSKELRSHDRRMRKQQKQGARKAARQARKEAAAQPATRKA